MNRYLILFFLALAPLIAREAPVLSKEALAFERIAALHKEQELAEAKKQIHVFFVKYPQSTLREQLLAILGDICIQEKSYAEAEEAYGQITNESLQHTVLSNELYALFFLKEYEKVEKLATLALEERGFSEEDTLKLHYFFAESVFRRASLVEDRQQQRLLFEKAKPHYAALSHSCYGNETLYPLAEIARAESDFPKAASLYLILAEKYPEKSEEYLFQAATMQSHFNKGDAIQTFAKAATFKGSLASSSRYNQLLLLYDTGRLEEVLAYTEKMLPQDKLPWLYFYQAQSHFALGDFGKASCNYVNFLSTQIQPSSTVKAAIYQLARCAKEENNPSSFEIALTKLHIFFPEEPAILEWEVEHARLLLEKGENPSENVIQQILYTSGSDEEKRTALLHFAQLLSYHKKWERAETAWRTLLSTYPQDKERKEMWLGLLRSLGETQQTGPLKQELALALQEDLLFSHEETREIRLQLATLLYESAQYKEALVELEKIENPDLRLVTFCHFSLSPTSASFIEHAEKALAAEVFTVAQQHMVHLQLFNAYYFRKESDNAAEHLFAAASLGPIKEENRVYLAEYYYTKAKINPQALERSVMLFESLLPEEFTPSLEEKLLKLSELYTLEGAFSKKCSLLERFTQAAKDAPLEWKYARFALFELAKTYETLGQTEQALSLYDTLIQTSTHLSSYIGNAASLQRSRLLFSSLPEEERSEGCPEMQEILSSFKDLQLKKQWHFEPLHLEAALEYLEAKTCLEPSTSKMQKTLSLLENIKEDFTSSQDLLHQEYHRVRQKEEKGELFTWYMHYLDARIAYTKALLATQEHQEEEAEIYEKSAMNELSLLLNSKSELPAPLLLRVEKLQEALRGIGKARF